jgi:uncharacterized membrane protein YeaQ/YmgE (transglycosylase-associated protein family)
MFDLNKTITKWRRQMLDAGIKNPVVLEELESHLREDIEQQLRFGTSAPRAFEIAVHKIGRPNTLRSEFRKNERATMKRTVTILLGILGIFVGPAIFLPALAQHREYGTWTTHMIVPVVLGTIIVLVGVGTAFYGSRMRRLKSC